MTQYSNLAIIQQIQKSKNRSLSTATDQNPEKVILLSITHTHTYTHTHTHTHTHPFNSSFSGTTRVSRYKKGKTRRQWVAVASARPCKSAPSSRQITTPAPHHSVFLQAGCPSCHPTNSVKAKKAMNWATDQNPQKVILLSTHTHTHTPV